jgi:hypothetical protein
MYAHDKAIYEQRKSTNFEIKMEEVANAMATNA